MKFKEKSTSKKSVSTKALYVAALMIALIAVSSLINNIMIFKDAVTQYVAQGYTYTEVIKQLIPMQLLPGVFESIAVYGGIASVLFAAGTINEKVSKSLIMLLEVQGNKNQSEENNYEDNVVDVESMELLEETGAIDQVNQAVEIANS
ncbi:hypothetical protein BD780_001180 [Clostridium tetanomorphum]|uniref:Uncharacterized protein n=1 Tax=Clostridium tetanomorphum TaxID=1553 RepID=A0A923E7I4_CLOTT|nr:hypothetical protein [Clostridium tetanomorphum]KAJ52386.1 hypothetical protein CTM_07806 [Clostridium tetanomorphum DSM 665]MBC2397905.1 hypothetical protein [Clostridium tetanomorphum]MBP1864779.1 hypothetical protein [Clostridium tetanomorphum]NRS83955.1 hypothetical protein [Clostridium tetanomorphum]NRZ97174.1 hypothetical protein [Clostridium tetanomorphum]